MTERHRGGEKLEAGVGEDLANVKRIIGHLKGERPGPTLVVVAAIHGNEKAGIHAARRVLSRLAATDVAFRGELIVVAGNIGAMKKHQRYQLRDLNRVWTADKVEALDAKPAAEHDAEEREQREILDVIRAVRARAKTRPFLVDLHTTSAAGVPFVIFGDSIEQRAFVSALPIPVIMGLESKLEGVLSSYCTTTDWTTFAVEGGQHDDPGSVDNLEAVLMLASEAAGLFPAKTLSDTRDARALLTRRRGDLPRVMEVIARYAITPEDQFVMEPGFRNLDHAKTDQLLARDARGEIRAPSDGLVMLPLYQSLGSDGFFWGKRTLMRF